MTTLFIYAWLLLAALPLHGATTPSLPQNDEKAIRDLITAHYSAWNQHDVKKMADLYASDGDIRTSLNQMGKNRKEIEAIYTSEHSQQMKEAHIEHTIKSMRMIKPDIAFVDAESTIIGMQTQEKSKYLPLHHHVAFVLVKREGNWKILIGRPF